VTTPEEAPPDGDPPLPLPVLFGPPVDAPDGVPLDAPLLPALDPAAPPVSALDPLLPATLPALWPADEPLANVLPDAEQLTSNVAVMGGGSLVAPAT
jgi:hypothetical protein